MHTPQEISVRCTANQIQVALRQVSFHCAHVCVRWPKTISSSNPSADTATSSETAVVGWMVFGGCAIAMTLHLPDKFLSHPSAERPDGGGVTQLFPCPMDHASPTCGEKHTCLAACHHKKFSISCHKTLLLAQYRVSLSAKPLS